MQGVIKSFDPGTGDGVILCDSDFREYDLATDALIGSPFRMLRQGQRVVFDARRRRPRRPHPPEGRGRVRHGHARVPHRPATEPTTTSEEASTP